MGDVSQNSGNCPRFPRMWEMDVDIDGLLRDGWTPRLKVVGGRRYVTLRKGNRKRSLGPYTPELWEEVRRHAQAVRKYPHLAMSGEVRRLRDELRALIERVEKGVSEIRADVAVLERRLREIPISNLYRDFKCSLCGSKHLVAVKFKCISCGYEG